MHRIIIGLSKSHELCSKKKKFQFFAKIQRPFLTAVMTIILQILQTPEGLLETFSVIAEKAAFPIMTTYW